MSGLDHWIAILLQSTAAAALGVGLWFCITRYKDLASFGRPIGLILSGVGFSLGLVYLGVRVFVCDVLPIFVGMEAAHETMGIINQKIAGPVTVLIALPVLAGFAYATEWLVQLVRQTTEARDKYKDELVHRHKLERDLTVALRKAEAANTAKSEFLATISHEVRTPLNGIIGFTDLMQHGEQSTETHRMLGYVRESGDKLLHLLNEILDISKIEAGKLDLEIQEFDVVQVFSEMENFWEYQFDDQVEFSVELDPNLEPSLIGDPLRVRQILDNLIGNANKFTENGQVSVKVSGEWGGGFYNLNISVADTGPGLSEEHQAKIFDPFTQADQTVSRTHGGTGLGLTICRSLAGAMNGEISVSSELGKGSTFTADLRLELPDVLMFAAAGI